MNDITELRKVLFDTLRGLRDKENPMDLDRAKAINETSQSIINSVKVEVDHMKITGGKGSGFIPVSAEPAAAGIPQTPAKPHLDQKVEKLNDAGNLITHRLI